MIPAVECGYLQGATMFKTGKQMISFVVGVVWSIAGLNYWFSEFAHPPERVTVFIVLMVVTMYGIFFFTPVYFLWRKTGVMRYINNWWHEGVWRE